MDSAPVQSLDMTPSAQSMRGFSLVEMVVVIAIITIISGIALLGQNAFNQSLILTNTAYTVAFSVREAQFLGISSRVFNGVQNAGYGVSFSRASGNSYALFADINPAAPGVEPSAVCPGHTARTGPEAKPGDCVQTQSSEIVRTYSLNNGFAITSFCGKDVAGGTERCSSNYLDSIHITYLRPSTQSIITGVHTSSGSRIALSDATIRIASPDGVAERCVYVSKAGQVSVATKGTTNCP